MNKIREEKRVLLILPAYNEAANIETTVEQILRFRPSGGYTLDYLIVNDGSADATEQICHERNFPCLSLIQNLGIGGAVQSGYLYARERNYDIAVQFDGDGQHDIRSLDALLAPILAGMSDLTVGSRFLEGTSFFQSTLLRRLGIRYLSDLIEVLCGIRITDPTSGFRAASRRAIAFLAEYYPVDYPEPESIVSLVRQGFSVSEVQVNMFPRQNGRSSIGPWRSVYYMCKVSLAVLCARFERRRGSHVAVSQS